MALTSKLQRDLAGERKAIHDYGQRKEEARAAGKPGLSSSLAEIQGDEKDHKRKLTNSLKGLHAAAK